MTSITRSPPYLLALWAFVFASGCGPRAPQAPANVILITFDTLRADHLGCYGYERNTSPNLDAFSEGSTRHARSMATSSWTVPTHASLFTGKAPFEHGAHAFPSEPGALTNTNVLAPQHMTLAEVLQGEGYETAAFMSNVAYLSPVWQLSRGFSTLYLEREYAESLNGRIFEWLAGVEDEPFFLFVNYIDTHRPYNTQPRADLLAKPPVQDEGESLDELIETVMPGQKPAPPDLVRRVVDQYDTAIANVDEEFGNLIETLRAMGHFENTIIVATSDHGEFFGEHRLVEHSKDIYQEAIWVPLLVKRPFQDEGQVETSLTSSMDVPGLILSELPAEIADRHREVFPNLPGNHPVISQIYYTRPKDLHHPIWGHRFDRVRTAVFDWPFKFIHSTDGEHELFDLAADPGEAENLVAREPGSVQRLMANLRTYIDQRQSAERSAANPELTEEHIERLRSLGYTGD